ncbi:MAG: DUF488 domain-containing protein [Chitinophagales bacterium]|nr:DUF488 domain-containing protein [Bacteroidota bacterium]MBK8680920.1 DUF488 domain-containing protein [Bacteroidota bacterium]MBP9187937.1 DUF488 domain-containing protein [Chitinophagales bacterium]MBP9549730.1 DUF488 domain-containing protein [Chitinophagales bacterium]
MSNNIQIKRIYEKPESSDGYRILIDRIWPRGIKKEDALLDEWNKEIAPSTELRKWFDHREERFAEFTKRYKKELQPHASELHRIKQLSKTKHVSLLYGAKDPNFNQAIVLLNILNQ